MMKCSLAGSIGLLLLCAAIGLNTVALILPMWSATEFNESSSSSAVKEADLAAGVWGFCTDAQVRISHTSRAANGTLAFDQCFFFHTATHFEVPKFGTAESFNFNDASICSGFASAVDSSNATERHAFVSTYAELAAQSTASFDKFLSRSCGALGYSVLLFAFAAPALGVLASLALIADMTCAGQRTISITAAKYLSVAAFVSGTIAVGLWVPQQYPIEDASFGGGFVVAGISAVFYLNVLVLCARHEHVTKPRKEEPGAEIVVGAADRQRVISEQV